MIHKSYPSYLAGGVAALLLSTSSLFAQFTTPNITTEAGSVTITLGGTTFINHGLQGVGRISGSILDSFGETFGSVSGMQITNWAGADGNYTGTFNILPDRGYNNNNAGGFFSAYEARIQTVDFSFTPYTGLENIGGIDLASKIAAQNQISITSPISGVKFTYLDPITGTYVTTTGLDPAAGQTTIFGKTVPYVTSYTGQQTPGGPNQTFPNINRLPLDSEAIVLKSDGSGYVGDEYGANIYYFNASKQIVGVITPPEALRPHNAGGGYDFNSTAGAANGRRNNQGFEGVSLSPDGTKLFALLQSATVQDTNGSQQQTRSNTRLVVYDVSSNATPDSPTAEYVIQLPTYTLNGGGGATTATAAQSEVIALDNNRLLVLSRDANGQGSATANPSAYKSILLVDLTVGNPTNIAGLASDNVGGQVSPGGVLDPAITPLSWKEAVNMLNSTQLEKFNISLDLGGANQVTKLTLGEKWEGLSLVSANDPLNPNDYFLFVANDNDFLTGSGKMIGPDGTLQTYDAFEGHSPVRQVSENDTMFLAYRVTITPPTAVPEPASVLLLAGGAALLAASRHRNRQA